METTLIAAAIIAFAMPALAQTQNVPSACASATIKMSKVFASTNQLRFRVKVQLHVVR